MRQMAAVFLLISLLSTTAAGAVFHQTDITGTVRDESGVRTSDAIVIAHSSNAPYIDRAVNGSDSVVPALLRLADDPPIAVSVNRTTEIGNYTVHFASRGTYQVIAVTENGAVSRVKTAEIELESPVVNLTIDAERVQQVQGGNAAGTPGQRTTFRVWITNSDDESIRNLTVSIRELPAGWRVESVETNGTYDQSIRQLHWNSVPANSTATANVTVSIPTNESNTTRTMDLAASSDSHHVEHTDPVRVRVGPPGNTGTPTERPTDIGGDGIQVTLPSPTPTSNGWGLLPSGVAVLLVGVAVSAYAVGRTGLPWAGRNDGQK